MKYPSGQPIKLTLNLETASSSLRPVRLEASSEVTPPESIPADLRESLTPFQFRVLSAAYLPDHYLDYRTPGVLEDAVARGLLSGNSVMINHSWDVRDWVGVVGRYWMDVEKDGIPAGINAELWIDREKANGRVDGGDIIRGIEIGAIHSCSLTVQFEWRKSHASMDDDTFWRKIGTTVNGEVVRVIATKILEIMELSLVWRGADRNARRTDTPKNMRTAENSASAEQEYTEGGDHVRETLAKILQKPVEEISEASLGAMIEQAKVSAVQAALKPLEEQIAERDAKTAQLEAKVTALEAEKAGLASLAKAGEEFLANLRKETARVYKLAVGDKADEATTRMIESASDVNQLKAWNSLYSPIAEKAMGELRCAACGSANLTRQQSAIVEPPTGKGNIADVEQARAIKGFAKTYFGAE